MKINVDMYNDALTMCQAFTTYDAEIMNLFRKNLNFDEKFHDANTNTYLSIEEYGKVLYDKLKSGEFEKSLSAYDKFANNTYSNTATVKVGKDTVKLIDTLKIGRKKIGEDLKNSGDMLVWRFCYFMAVIHTLKLSLDITNEITKRLDSTKYDLDATILVYCLAYDFQYGLNKCS